jgi:hypothetical protein
MGIALVTTLLGLIVSIILNLCSTGVFRYFNNNLGIASTKSDELRLALLSQDSNSNGGPKPDDEETIFKLISLSDQKLTGIVNKQLKQPIVLQLINEHEEPVANRLITCRIEKGKAVFDNNEKTVDIETDSNGKAIVNLRMGKSIGQSQLICFAKELENSELEFTINTIAGAPALLTPLSEEMGSVKINKKLSQPLIVQLRDDFNNPIANYPVKFSTSGGFFNKKGQQSIEVETDTNGEAAVEFTAGDTPAINQIAAQVKDLENQIVKFNIMSVKQ